MTPTPSPHTSRDKAKTGPESDEEQIVVTAVEARQGRLGRPVLIVLCVSLVLAVLAGLAVGYLEF